MDLVLGCKILGAVFLFIVTFLITYLPYKLKNIQPSRLKTITCFCGGVSSFQLFMVQYYAKNIF